MPGLPEHSLGTTTAAAQTTRTRASSLWRNLTDRTRAPGKGGLPASKLSQKQTPQIRRTGAFYFVPAPMESGFCCLGQGASSAGAAELRMPQTQKGKETERLLPHRCGRQRARQHRARTEADSDFKGQKQQEQRLQALVLGRLGSPSGRTPWTSCPVTWLFGVETGGRRRRPGEELWGLHWGGPVAESSRQSVLLVSVGRQQGGRQPELWRARTQRPAPK